MEPSILIDERQDIQKKTFTKWINSHLIKTQCATVNDLFEDLRDGNCLLALLSVLTGHQLKPEKGRMRVHHINNLNKVMQVIQEHGVKLVNISSDDIVGGNPKLTLGLIWLIALEFNGHTLVKSHSSNGVEKSLLAWARQYTEPHGIQLNDFSNSWADGRAFLMILDAHLEDVDLSITLTKHPLARLKTAFDLAYEYFKIEKLLDPEDVHTHKPDNKSIQMYVMCLYHAMESRRSAENCDSTDERLLFDEKEQEILVPPSRDVTDLDEVPLDSVDDFYSDVSSNPVSGGSDNTKTQKYASDIIDMGTDDVKNGNFMPDNDKSRPISTATNASVEIGNYQAALEAVLTLLLEDEQILSRALPEPNDFQTAKLQFHENEHFMLKLTEHQQYVGEALEEGSNLINESQKGAGISMEDQNEIRQQMVLLNERWETLRLRALDVQAKILLRLADFQTQQLEKLRSFLTNVEDRISHMSEIGPSLAEVQKQINEAKELKDDLNNQQELVDSLGNMVVIVNDESGNFNDLEDKLSALGERWSHVVKWSDLRMEKLQQYKCISCWLDTREQDLKTMESKDVIDLGGITRRMNDLNYCAKDLLELERYLLDLRQMVAAALQEGDDKGEQVLARLENFEDRLDALKQIVEVQTDRIETKGFKFGRDRASYDDSRVICPEGWIDFQLIIKFGEHDLDEDMKEEPQKVVIDADGSPLANKKRKLRNADNFYLLEGRIMDTFNFLDDCEENLQGLSRRSLRNQTEILKDMEKQLLQRKGNINELRELLELCEKEDPERNFIMEVTHIRQIEERLELLLKRGATQLEIATQLIDREKFYNSLTGFKLVLADSRDWYKQHANTASKSDLEQRLSDMESLSTEITAAKTTTSTLGNEYQEWKHDFNIFYESWNDMKRAIITLIQEKGGLDEVNQRLNVLKDFIERLANCEVIVSSLEPMQKQLKLLNELVKEYENLKIDYDYIKQLRPDALSIEFSEQWSKWTESLNERVIKQTTAIENINHFTEEYGTIWKQLEKLESSLRIAESNLEENFTQNNMQDMAKSNVSVELRKVEIDVISARNFADLMMKDAEPNHREFLANQIKELNGFFIKVQILYNKFTNRHTEILAKTEEIFERLNATDSWLDEMEQKTPKTKISEINNSNELFQIKSKFQTLKECCERETLNFRELNDLSGEILLQIDELKNVGEQTVNTKNATLAKKLTRLNARWTVVTSLIYTRTALLEHISTQLGEFKKFMVSELGYLDRLENKMRSTPENADAEEIIEELDDLENILRAHSDEWLEKIQEIGEELIEHEFTANEIRKEIDTILERWNQLQQRAKQRTAILEQEVSEAEESEKCIVQFEAWLTRVDEILSDHLENDVTIEDLPEDFHQLVKEFETNEKSFQEIDELIAEHTRNGKLEAANRLQEQLNLLELRFKSCQMKLNKCTAPQPAYESRLNRAVAELRNVERSTLVLDVATAGPSAVNVQYEKCLQIYRTLSEIKGEIESTIKTGRKVCEDRYTKSPKQLSQRIDALKHLYNALGENVTQSKIFLEGLIKLAQQLDECYQAAERLIGRFESPGAEMHDRNADFLVFEDVLQRCEQIYAEYGKSVDAVCMVETRQKIDELKATYLRLTSADVIKRLTEMKSTLQNLDNISLDTLKTMEHDLKQISVPSNPEIESLQQQVIAIVVTVLSQRFKYSSSLKDLLKVKNKQAEKSDAHATEIVVVSDTVRQRRPRTPNANETVIVGQQQQQVVDKNNGLPAQTFCLAETSTLFSQISQAPANPPTPPPSPTNNMDTIATVKQKGNVTRQQASVKISGGNHNGAVQAQMVEIKAKNITSDKMSVRNIDFEPTNAESVNTVNVCASVKHFKPEHAETVQILDLSEDSDSSMRMDVESGGSLANRRGQQAMSANNDVDDDDDDYDNIDNDHDNDNADDDDDDDDVELRMPGPTNTSTPLLRVEKQRISFDEKRKRLGDERDILRDSEEEGDIKNDGTTEQPKAKRWRQIQHNIIEQLQQPSQDNNAELPCDSFYNADKDASYEAEPLVFSEDEEIPRFSMEMTPTLDSDSDMSRIETPGTKKSNNFSDKVLSKSPSSMDDSNITLKSPQCETLRSFPNNQSLEQRVQDFEKTAKYMIRKLEATREKIELCDEGEDGVEDLKMLIAPDAATLISQGDSLVLETHGKQGNLSRLVMRTQILLREKFREVQQAKSKIPKSQQGNNAPSPRSTLDKISIKDIDLEELAFKGLKRINDLIEKPLDRTSAEELECRLNEINDRRDDLKLIVNAIGKSEQMPRIDAVMINEIEKTKNNLQAHADGIEVAFCDLEKAAINGASKDYNASASGSGPLATSFDKSVLQISDWLTWEQNMIKLQSVPVDDIDAIRLAIEKQEKVSRELKLKKPQLNELVHTAEVLKGDVKRQQLQEKALRQFSLAPNCSADLDYIRCCLKVTRLREHWEETSQCVLQRATHLKNMLSDSQRYEAKRLELEKWLLRMEARTERMGTVAITADVLEAQQKEQKSFHAELHQNKQQFELFNELTQNLIAVYPADDTSRIKKMTEAINLRYTNLNNGVINRGKQLHAAVHNLQSFDRAMDQFLAFLSETENLCESAESEIDRNPLMFKVSLTYFLLFLT